MNDSLAKLEESQLIDKRRQILTKIATLNAEKKRTGGNLKILAVTKNREIEDMLPLLNLGLTSWGENRSQELVAKQEFITSSGLASTITGIDWHFIGTLQKNKVKQVVGRVSLIHSVDSFELLKEIDKVAHNIAPDYLQNILLQVNYSGEASKHGFTPGEIAEFPILWKNSTYRNIRICGLMTMAPKNAEPEILRDIFNGTANLLEAWREDFPEFFAEIGSPKELSMGMSDDYAYAIEAGATIIRLGRALF